MDEATARQHIERLVAASSEPTLDDGDLDLLVEEAKRSDPVGNAPSNVAAAPTWAPSTTYAYGDVVTANPSAGRWWRCVVPGISGTTQPSWPSLGGQIAAGTPVSESTGLQWEDAGSPWAPTWDLNAAACKGWEIKAGLAAEDFPFTTDGQEFERNKVIDHCERMADRYRRRIVASAPTTSC